ncbi:amidohydrolase [Amycolatopsis acidiphila]|uniref:Amidohydrolase n=1 Tax=Amycolatopsis acidiphila TaxID=715473 RepID=A0A558AP83_9PSEU|nr:amidohydrolase [Amycolatopsis acidiphila]TVT26067.1 amidohydrolase [Amycolatopsis acidiphila]UIJ63208.1 amidohydrolase [Amycolatopsis acidiphila]GHG74353.1 amidohydrolase [Amycolatopsis acidiphila]
MADSTKSAADELYVNGRIWTGRAPEVTALAVRDGRVAACGAEAMECAGPGTRVVDLQGRRVIPGLVDGHLHAARAGATWTAELHWTGLPDVPSALATIKAAARDRPVGEWIRAIGGWHPCQFTESREPTRAELDAVAPGHPVYVQALYEVAVLNSAGLRATGLDRLSGNPPGGWVERAPVTGEPTGRVHGMGAFTHCLDAMAVPGPDEQLRSTAAMFADLHAAGLTGIVDAGGFGMAPERYDPLFTLWRRGELSMRARLFLSAVDPGREQAQLDGWLRHAHSRFGDGMLQVLGIGEVVHFGCHDFEGLEEFRISEAAAAQLYDISYATAARGWPMNIHAVLDSSIDVILDCWEAVDRLVPLRGLRFTLSHADRIGARNLRRLKALGAGIVLDDHQVFKAAASEAAWGPGSMETVPPVADILAEGIPVAAGTDASRASSYSPWLSLWWLVTGTSLDGAQRRSARQLFTRERALEAYTAGSAWLSFEEATRGHLRRGARADFAVLSDDYFTVSAERIPSISAELTVVGGKVVHSTGAVG